MLKRQEGDPLPSIPPTQAIDPLETESALPVEDERAEALPHAHMPGGGLGERHTRSSTQLTALSATAPRTRLSALNELPV